MYLESLLEKLDMGQAELDLIRRAYWFAEAAHAGVVRRSGEPYITHCVEVAKILADMKLEAAAIAAALLHDTIEDTHITLQELEENFGVEVAALVDGVSKLDTVPRVRDGQRVMVKIDPGKEEAFLRKTIRAMGRDVRAFLIKLADRLHNLRTLDSLSEHRQRAIAQETLEIFSVVAYRLGMWELKCELEDLSFPYVWPRRYREIINALESDRLEADIRLREAAARVASSLEQIGLPAEVYIGEPHAYALYLRSQEKNVPLAQLHSLRPIRIVVEDLIHCYTALGLVHNTWRPIQKEFHDYIAVPKDNHYQSLHTTVRTNGGGFLTLQIRTRHMHQIAQHGVASRWLFHNGKESDIMFEQMMGYMNRLLREVDHGSEDAVEYISNLRYELKDRIHVLTPQGEEIELPRGATPIDFAYHIHTDVGHRCRGANVDDKMVSLDYELHSGDKVEIVTAQSGGPMIEWLNPHLGYVRTKRAHSKIRRWFRHQDAESAVALGKDVVDDELRRLGIGWMTYDDVTRLFDQPVRDFLQAVGQGDIPSYDISVRILENEDGRRLHLVGVDGLRVHMAECCNPLRGQAVTAMWTGEWDVAVHRTNCPQIEQAAFEDLLYVSWQPLGDMRFPVEIVIIAYDREGLMGDIGDAVASEGINMTDVVISTSNNMATFYMTTRITNFSQLICAFARIERLPNVRVARRHTHRRGQSL